MVSLSFFRIFIVTILVTFYGYIHPFLETTKAILSEDWDAIREYLTYWVTFTIISSIEFLIALTQQSKYYPPEFRLFYILWLVHPRFQGAYRIYTYIVKPYFEKYESNIDEHINVISNHVKAKASRHFKVVLWQLFLSPNDGLLAITSLPNIVGQVVDPMKLIFESPPQHIDSPYQPAPPQPTLSLGKRILQEFSEMLFEGIFLHAGVHLHSSTLSSPQLYSPPTYPTRPQLQVLSLSCCILRDNRTHLALFSAENDDELREMNESPSSSSPSNSLSIRASLRTSPLSPCPLPSPSPLTAGEATSKDDPLVGRRLSLLLPLYLVRSVHLLDPDDDDDEDEEEEEEDTDETNSKIIEKSIKKTQHQEIEKQYGDDQDQEKEQVSVSVVCLEVMGNPFHTMGERESGMKKSTSGLILPSSPSSPSSLPSPPSSQCISRIYLRAKDSESTDALVAGLQVLCTSVKTRSTARINRFMNVMKRQLLSRAWQKLL